MRQERVAMARKKVDECFQAYYEAQREYFGALEAEDEESQAPAEQALPPSEILMTAKQVSSFLGFSYCYFRQLVSNGNGPPYYEYGRNVRRYKESDVIAWAEARRRGGAAQKAQ